MTNYWLDRRAAKDWHATLEIQDSFLGSTLLPPVLCGVTKTLSLTNKGSMESLTCRFTQPVAVNEAYDFCEQHRFNVTTTSYYASICVYDKNDHLREKWGMIDLILVDHSVHYPLYSTRPDNVMMDISSHMINRVQSVYIK